MKKEQRELATDLVKLVEHHLGDHYRDVNETLNSSLVGGAMETTPEEAISNKDMLDEVAAQLPPVERLNVDVVDVIARDLSQVRWLQSSIIWQRNYYNSSPSPAYLFGVCAEKKRVSLLLREANLAERPRNTYIAHGIPADQFEEAEVFMRTRRTAPLSEEELSKVYRGGSCRVNATFMPAVQMTNGSRGDRRSIQRQNRGGIVLRATEAYQPITAISDETLARYNVFDHLAHLAVGFGKAAEVNTIIDSKGTES